MSTHDRWMDALPINKYGRKALTFSVVQRVVQLDPSGWYVAPFRLGWTVGKTAYGALKDRSFHVVKNDGEPLFFDTVDAALGFLRLELKILRAPILNCVPA